jgi:hypothetical protein
MRDSLEKFIEENRDAFDKDIPNLKIWAAIDKTLHPEQKKPRFTWHHFRIAASIVLLIGIGMTAGIIVNKNWGNERVLAHISPEFREMEDFYQRKLTAVRTTVPASAIDPVMQTDLEQLETIMKELQAEYKKAPESSREQIIRAMITTYQSKLKILERLLETNNQQPSSHSTNQQHETVI